MFLYCSREDYGYEACMKELKCRFNPIVAAVDIYTSKKRFCSTSAKSGTQFMAAVFSQKVFFFVITKPSADTV